MTPRAGRRAERALDHGYTAARTTESAANRAALGHVWS